MKGKRVETTCSDWRRDGHQVMKGLLERLGRSPGEDAAALEEFGGLLERRIEWEEEVLFPAAAALEPGLQSGPIAVSLHEHGRLRAEKDAALAAVRAGDFAEVRARTEAMAGLLDDHEAKEGHILYPACDALLGDALAGILPGVRPG